MIAALPVLAAPRRRHPSLEIDCALATDWLVAFLRDELIERRGIARDHAALEGRADALEHARNVEVEPLPPHARVFLRAGRQRAAVGDDRVFRLRGNAVHDARIAEGMGQIANAMREAVMSGPRVGVRSNKAKHRLLLCLRVVTVVYSITSTTS